MDLDEQTRKFRGTRIVVRALRCNLVRVNVESCVHALFDISHDVRAKMDNLIPLMLHVVICVPLIVPETTRTVFYGS